MPGVGEQGISGEGATGVLVLGQEAGGMSGAQGRPV